jgi:hypothetical protein
VEVNTEAKNLPDTATQIARKNTLGAHARETLSKIVGLPR